MFAELPPSDVYDEVVGKETYFETPNAKWERLAWFDQGRVNGTFHIANRNHAFAEFLKTVEIVSNHLAFAPEVVEHCKEIGKRFFRDIGNLREFDGRGGTSYNRCAQILSFILGEAWNEPYAERVRSMKQEFCELFDIGDIDFWRLRRKLATWTMEHVRAMETRMQDVLGTGYF